MDIPLKNLPPLPKVAIKKKKIAKQSGKAVKREYKHLDEYLDREFLNEYFK